MGSHVAKCANIDTTAMALAALCQMISHVQRNMTTGPARHPGSWSSCRSLTRAACDRPQRRRRSAIQNLSIA
eukprot:7382156-Lingulodinium_polyedra.AAC.1